jgi:hypothetical protein
LNEGSCGFRKGRWMITKKQKATIKNKYKNITILPIICNTNDMAFTT